MTVLRYIMEPVRLLLIGLGTLVSLGLFIMRLGLETLVGTGAVLRIRGRRLL